MAKGPIKNVELEGVVSQQATESDHEEYTLKGDLTFGGSPLVVGVMKGEGQGALFDYLDSGLKD